MSELQPILSSETPESLRRIAWFNEQWQYAPFRLAMRMQTLIWGVGLVFEALVRTYLVLTMSVAQFLAVSPFILYGIIGATFAIGALYMRRWRKRYGGLSGASMRQAGPSQMISNDSGEQQQG